MKKILLKLLCVIVMVMLLSPTAMGQGLDDWEDGDEVALLGHSFDEEYWTSEISNETEEMNTTFVVSYVNHNNVQAFLVAFKDAKSGNATGTFPYQMYGMHYFTPDGNEVFIGALLAFLMVYNDSNNNSIPNPGQPHHEDILYVIPFGIDNSLNESSSYAPTVTPIPAQKLGEGHYRFGMRYQNLYAYVSPFPLWSWIFKTGWLAKFSELTVTYDITIDNDTGEVRTETYYTIGQVTELWAFILGIPIEADPSELPESLGVSAVHFVTIFTSKYKITGETSGNTISPTSTELADENITIAVGEKNERAFAIRFMGEFDLIDENSGSTIEENNPAYNILVQAKPLDVSLVAWQLKFSAAVFSIFAYALSDYVQSVYSSPRDLAHKSLLPFNPKGFGVKALWYAVCFPSWQGYRVEHDPTYTAYFGDPATSVDDDEEGGACGSGGLIFIGALFIPGAAGISKRFRRKKKQ